MQRKLFIVVLLLSVLLLPLLAGCGAGGEVLEVEEVSIDIDKDTKVASITVKYLDDMADPLSFEVPLQGLKGDDGLGIKGIKLSEKKDGKQTMTIQYTDASVPDVVVDIKDGATLTSAEKIEENGVYYMLMTLSDGSTQKVELPEGVPGVGIQNVIPDEDEDGNTLLSFELTDGTTIGPVKVLRGIPGLGLKNEIVTEPQYDENGRPIGVNVKFVLEDGSETNAVTIQYLGISRVESEDVFENGVVVGKLIHLYSTNGDELDSFKVMDGVSISGIESEPLATGETKVTVMMSNGTAKIFTLPAAASIKSIKPKTAANGNMSLVIEFTDDRTPIEVPLQAGNGIANITAGKSEDGTKYVMEIEYTNGGKETVEFDKPSAWHRGSGEPNKSVGNNGDYYYDFSGKSIYYKSNGTWQLQVSFLDFTNEQTITFKLAPGESWTNISEGSTYSIQIQYGSSFAASGFNLPIPHKEGYNFVGWYTTDKPNFAVNSVFNDLSVVSGDLTLYAVWERIS